MTGGTRTKWVSILVVCVLQILYYISRFSLDELKWFLKDPSAYTYQIIFSNQGVFVGFPLYWVKEIHLIFLAVFLVLSLWNVFRWSPSNLNWPGLVVTGVLIFWPTFFNLVLFPVIFLTGMDCLWNPDCL